MRKPRRTASAAVALATLLLLGACGGGDDPAAVATLSGADGESAAADDDGAPTEEDVVAWVECMREQGIDIADPSVDGEGDVVLGAGPRVVVARPGAASGSASGSGDEDMPEPPDREQFEDAVETCGEPPRVGGSLSQEDRQAFQDAALKMARCMREQGVDFPDPVFSDSGPGGPAERAEEAPAPGERTGPFGDVDMADPKVQAAFETCRGDLGDAVPGPPGAVARALPAGGEG